jgi:hypothetical protein
MTKHQVAQRVSGAWPPRRLRAAVSAVHGLRRWRVRVAEGPRDRGDVPGWVLVTIMTAGLVVALWAIAGPKLGQLFGDAVDSVHGP